MKFTLALTLGAALMSAVAWGQTPKEASDSHPPVDEKTTNQLTEKNKAILSEAREAIKETKNALTLLDQNKTKEAQTALQEATGKLEMAVARKPELGLAAFDVTVKTNALLNNAASVNQIKEEAIKALQENRVQEARQMVSTLRSDTVISVANIPLETYPTALKTAARLIDEKRVEEAKVAITTALSTVVITETVIPLPLARADFFIDDAAKLGAKRNRTTEEKDRLAKDIANGREALKMAEALGYVPNDTFKDSYAKLDQAQEEAEAGKTGDWFKDVQNKISSYFDVKDQDTAQAQEE